MSTPWSNPSHNVIGDLRAAMEQAGLLPTKFLVLMAPEGVDGFRAKVAEQGYEDQLRVEGSQLVRPGQAIVMPLCRVTDEPRATCTHCHPISVFPPGWLS